MRTALELFLEIYDSVPKYTHSEIVPIIMVYYLNRSSMDIHISYIKVYDAIIYANVCFSLYEIYGVKDGGVESYTIWSQCLFSIII